MMPPPLTQDLTTGAIGAGVRVESLYLAVRAVQVVYHTCPRVFLDS